MGTRSPGCHGTMRTRAFPPLESDVSELGYGSWPLSGAFGGFDEGVALKSVYDYLDAGGNFIDTARAYGRAEELIGKVLRGWRGPAPILATKVESLGPSHRWGSRVDVADVFPPGQIRASAMASLEALGTDHVDLLQLHIYWPTWGVDGYWLDELHELKREGVTRAIGVSIPDYRHDGAIHLVRSGAIDSVQTIVNVFDPLALDGLIPIAKAAGVAVIARGVLDEGGLTDAYMDAAEFSADDLRHTYFAQTSRAEYLRRATPLRELIPHYSATLAGLCIKAVLAQPGVTTAIVSMPTSQWVSANMQVEDEPVLPADIAARLMTRHRWVRNFFEPVYCDDGQ